MFAVKYVYFWNRLKLSAIKAAELQLQKGKEAFEKKVSSLVFGRVKSSLMRFSMALCEVKPD